MTAGFILGIMAAFVVFAMIIRHVLHRFWNNF